jgi:hypothetical protein
MMGKECVKKGYFGIRKMMIETTTTSTTRETTKIERNANMIIVVKLRKSKYYLSS